MVLVPIFGMLDDDLDQLLRTLYSAQTVTMGFRPVIMTDQNVFSQVRPYGWVVEHLTSERSWIANGYDGEWIAQVIFRAGLAARFYGAVSVLLPDPLSHNRNLLSQIQGLTGTSVDSLSILRGAASREELEVSGWRGWLDLVSSSEMRFRLSVDGQSHGVRARRGSAGSTVAFDSELLERTGLSAVLADALRRDWSYVVIDQMGSLSAEELQMMIGALLDGLTSDGTLMTVTDGDVSTLLAQIVDDERIIFAGELDGSLVIGEKPAKLSEAELRTMVYRASRALVGSRAPRAVANRLGHTR